MKEKNNSYVYCKSRHLRHLFFINRKIDIINLINLMCQNQKFWGGRYNPIIPVNNGEIPDNYLEYIKYSDPDFVFYSEGTNLTKVESFLNPKKYYKIEKFGTPKFEGLDCTYLLEHSTDDALLCESGYLYKSNLKDNLQFYELNFLFQSYFFDKHELLHRYKKITINHDNLKDINKIIALESLIYKSILSKRDVYTNIFKTSELIDQNLELVIADENEQFNDLLYYWNRQMYLEKHYCLNQIYITVQQLERLSNDRDFHLLLSSLSKSKDIKVHSETLNNSRLQEIININLLNDKKMVNFFIKEQGKFPFKIDDIQYYKHMDEKVYTKQVLIENQGLLNLPKPSFAASKNLSQEKWAVDIIIEDVNEQENRRNKIKLPFGTFIFD